jgi:uncharacterized protein
VTVATRGADGRLGWSPKCDPAGFVRVLDEHTLAIPDRPGNNRLNTFQNLRVNAEVGIFFLLPDLGDTLRVSGKAQIVRDGRLQRQMAINGKEPRVVLVVSVEEALMHCPKCMVRSGLWKKDRWPVRTDVPTLAQALVTRSAFSISEPERQARIDNDGATRLY